MYSLLIVLIYIGFISLGLPDSLLGSAWPSMQPDMNVPISYAGIVTMVITGGTVISSLLAGRLIHRFGTGLVTAVSVMTTAMALFGFSLSDSFWMLLIWGIPYGLGAGAIDAALNNYVALNYSSRHMNWLHCFWGVGAAISPYIMSYYLTSGLSFRSGYRSISIIQVFLTVILFASLTLWKREKKGGAEGGDSSPILKLSQIIKLKGAKFVLIAFFAYCGMEATAYTWASTYLVRYRGIEPGIAAGYAALFFIGITAGRFLSGIVSEKIGDRNMIRTGIAIIIVGLLLVWLPIPIDWVCLYGLVIIGFGCGPIYPAIIHSTPINFGKENSQSMIGVQMASAYTGSTFMPPLFGLLANGISFGIFPIFLMFFVVLMLIMTERLNRVKN